MIYCLDNKLWILMRNNMEAVLEYLKENSPEAIIYDNCNDAIVGTARIQREGEFVEVVLYDKELLIEVFTRDFSSNPEEGNPDELDYELQAIEWVEYNIEGAYLGKFTPVILR